MARWIGCISSTKVLKGSAEIPDATVWSTTENAPSWRAVADERTEAARIRFRFRPVPAISR